MTKAQNPTKRSFVCLFVCLFPSSIYWSWIYYFFVVLAVWFLSITRQLTRVTNQTKLLTNHRSRSIIHSILLWVTNQSHIMFQCGRSTTHHVSFCGNHLKQSVVILQNMNVQKMHRRKRPLTTVASVTMHTVIVGLIATDKKVITISFWANYTVL